MLSAPGPSTLKIIDANVSDCRDDHYIFKSEVK